MAEVWAEGCQRKSMSPSVLPLYGGTRMPCEEAGKLPSFLTVILLLWHIKILVRVLLWHSMIHLL